MYMQDRGNRNGQRSVALASVEKRARLWGRGGFPDAASPKLANSQGNFNVLAPLAIFWHSLES